MLSARTKRNHWGHEVAQSFFKNFVPSVPLEVFFLEHQREIATFSGKDYFTFQQTNHPAYFGLFRGLRVGL